MKTGIHDIRLPQGVKSYTEILITVVESYVHYDKDMRSLHMSDKIRYVSRIRAYSEAYDIWTDGEEYFSIDYATLIMRVAEEWRHVDLETVLTGLKLFKRMGETVKQPIHPDDLNKLYDDIIENVLYKKLYNVNKR